MFRWAQAAAAASPDDLARRHDLALAHDFLGTIAERAGEQPRADAHFRRVAELAESLCAAEPERLVFRELAFTSAERLALVTGRADIAAGEAMARRAHAAAVALHEADPENRFHVRRLAVSHHIEQATGWTIKRFVRTFRQYRDVTLTVAGQTITASQPIPADEADTLTKIKNSDAH